MKLTETNQPRKTNMKHLSTVFVHFLVLNFCI